MFIQIFQKKFMSVTTKMAAKTEQSGIIFISFQQIYV